MAHLLLLELPGACDTSILETALQLGHTVTFVTADLTPYRRSEYVWNLLGKTKSVIEIKPFSYDEFEARIAREDAADPFSAVLCLICVRLIEAARIAEMLKVPYLSASAATLLRDKYSVRVRLREHGLRQPDFALARNNDEIIEGIKQLKLPLLIKPSDGFGSQYIALFRTKSDFFRYAFRVDQYLPLRTDYGHGVVANDRQLMERYIEGRIIGCDTFTVNGRHHLLGIIEKTFYPPPMFAISGSVFPSQRFDLPAIREYLFSVLDAVGFNHGASHTEIVVTSEGPWLIEINGRLVGAGISRLLSLALDRSVHEMLLDLHLGRPVVGLDDPPPYFAASRWVSAETSGILRDIVFPDDRSEIALIDVANEIGDEVQTPMHCSTRIVCVMARGRSMEEAEGAAQRFVDATKLVVEPTPSALTRAS